VINTKTLKRVKQTYQIDLIEDVFFSSTYHVTFIVDLLLRPRKIQILTGDVTLLGFSKQESFLFSEIASHIETENALAEVEGKETFLEDLTKKLINITEDMQLYIPLKIKNGTLWLLVGIDILTKNEGHTELIFGRINRIYDNTPKGILYYKSTYQDSLTRLFTRETLKIHLQNPTYLEGAYGIYFDIDHFKTINDIYGHKAGDLFLIELANRFIANWEKDVIYYRLGGDEFFVFVLNHSEKQIIDRAKQIIFLIENLNEKAIAAKVSASIGIVPIKKECYDYTKLLDLGDKAMYESKNKGKGMITFAKDV